MNLQVSSFVHQAQISSTVRVLLSVLNFLLPEVPNFEAAQVLDPFLILCLYLLLASPLLMDSDFQVVS